MASRLLVAAILCATCAHSSHVNKTVLNTVWWPPGTEKQAESIGILARKMIYMTGMMESNATLEKTVLAEISDMSDIAAAANSTTGELLGCVANAATGTGPEVQQLFSAHLPGVPISVAEMAGEFPMFNTSISCVGTTSSNPVRRTHLNSSGSLANGVLTVSAAHSELGTALDQMLTVIRQLGGSGLNDLADCTAFVKNISQAAHVRERFGATALTIVQAGVAGVTMQCTGTVSNDSELVIKPIRAGPVTAAMANGFVYVSGIGGNLRNGTDTLEVLRETLALAGLGMESVVNCVFYVKSADVVPHLFQGFYQVFNQNSPPPPSRTEFVGASECASCQVLSKCIAVV